MASDVDIANLALSHLGDGASVAAINPPEASPQARWCARFYPIARDTLLAMHCWDFATRRQLGQLIASTIDQWAYSYALPTGALQVFAVLSSDAQDSYSESTVSTSVFQQADGTIFSRGAADGLYTPQPFEVETLTDGTKVVYTNQEDALLRYTVRVTDTAKFSPLFVVALSYLLASYVAGPMIKGKTGREVAREMLTAALSFIKEAEKADTSQRNVKPTHSVPWMAAR